MTASRAITIAAIAGTILLIPVIVILSLGLYGSSIAADLAAIEPRGPKVAADPEQGPPGSSITLRGSNWIPETLARLEMVVRPSKPALTAAGEVVEEASPLPPVFIGTVITSRVGTFSVTANVPTSFPLRSGDDVDFVVTATYRGGEPAGRATGSFRIEPGPGGIEVQVYAEREGAPLPAALVELRGGQGQTLAAARADARGKALFAGLPAEARYRVMARAPGFGVLTAENVETTADAPREVTFVLSSADVAHAYVAGVPVGGAPASLVVLDLVSMVPVSAIEIVRSRPTWALAGDAGRERVYLADEVAEEIRVVDAVSGAELDPIRLAFDLHIRVTAPNGRRIEGASVRAFWLVRGDRVLVRLGETNAFGEVRFEGLITGSTYEIAVGADGYRQDIGDRPRVVVAPNVGAEITVKLEPSEGPVNSAPPVALGAPVFAQQQVPATALVVADLAVDPATGMLYVTGSDLENGHLLVIDPDRGAIVHDWRVPAGVADLAPAGDGRAVYIANRAFSTVARIDVATGKELARAVVPSWPEAIVADGDGAVFSASLRNGRVTRLDGETLVIEASRSLEPGLNRLVIVPEGSTLLVSNVWTDTVTALDASDLTLLFLLPVEESPRAMAVDPRTGSLVIGSARGGTVAVYGLDGYELRERLALNVPINDVATVPVTP